MATKPRECNKFIELKKSIAGLYKDIAFLKQCKKHRLTPVSHKVIVKTAKNPDIIKDIEMQLLRRSIKALYGRINVKTLECYSLYLKLAKEFQDNFQIFLTKVKIAEFCESERKRKSLSEKFNKLKYQNPKFSRPSQRPNIHNIDGIVVNRSSEQFTDEQLTLLNKGLTYAIPKKPDTTQTVIDIETAINNNNLQTSQIQKIRIHTANIIRNTNTTPPKQRTQHNQTTQHKTGFLFKSR